MLANQWVISRFTITDYKPRDRPLNVPEIMVYSSNIGSARIAEEIGVETQRIYMDKLGLLDRLPLEVPETSKPLSPTIWQKHHGHRVLWPWHFNFNGASGKCHRRR